MPLYKTIDVNKNSKVLIWKIEESFEQLSNGIELTTKSTERVQSMKSELHQRGFLHLTVTKNNIEAKWSYVDQVQSKEYKVTHSHKVNWQGA